ncbi:MAG: TIR domain-containing protein [Candidatus Accumulibacter delftensis]
MNDVFISYTRENRAQARAIAQMLAKRGLDVWWDVQLLPGQQFATEINAVISRAKAVVVLWTNESIHSQWVQSESSLALKRGILVPVQLEKVDLPAPYNTLHTLDLSDWDGSPEHPLLEELVAGIGLIAGEAAPIKKTRTDDEVAKVLQEPAYEVDYWMSISSKYPQSVGEYKLYLDKYGNKGVFTEMASLRISELTAANDAKKRPNLATVLTYIGGVVAIALGIVQIIDIVGKGLKVDRSDNQLETPQSTPARDIRSTEPPAGGNAVLEREPSSANSTPVARRDNVLTDAVTIVNGSLLGPDFGGADFDPDGDRISVYSVEGSKDNVGKPLVLPSGATVIVESNGNFSYNPRTGYSFLTKPGSSSADSLTYSIVDERGAKSTEIQSMFMVVYPKNGLRYSPKDNARLARPEYKRSSVADPEGSKQPNNNQERANKAGYTLITRPINCDVYVADSVGLDVFPEVQGGFCEKLLNEIRLASGCELKAISVQLDGASAVLRDYGINEPYRDVLIAIDSQYIAACKPAISQKLVAQARYFPELRQLVAKSQSAFQKKVVKLLEGG